MVELILQLLFAHCLGDYLFQTNYLASNKGKDNYLLFVHSVLYTLAVYLVFGTTISYLGYWLILLTHIPIDYVKARGITPKKYGDNKALIIDQIIHYIVLIISIII